VAQAVCYIDIQISVLRSEGNFGSGSDGGDYLQALRNVGNEFWARPLCRSWQLTADSIDRALAVCFAV